MSVSTQPTVPEGNEEEEEEEEGGPEPRGEEVGYEGGEEEKSEELEPAKPSKEDRMAKLRELRLRMVSRNAEKAGTRRGLTAERIGSRESPRPS